MKELKARGHRGSWFARVGDDDIPCAWHEWLRGMHYSDPHFVNEGKWVKYLEALQRDRKIVLTRKREKDGKWLRDGYIGVFKITNITVSDRGLEFELTERLPIRLK
jgi:hypothetical protein